MKLSIKTVILGFFILMMVSACNCSKNSPMLVQPIQKADKQLSCKDIILEINEAEFHRKNAAQKRGGSLDYMFSPLCYPTGYMDAKKAEKAALERLEYLNQIYDLMDCEMKSRYESKRLPTPPTVYDPSKPFK